MTKVYDVYTIIRRPKQDEWLAIGVAFPHDDEKGFNVTLKALPVHDRGKVVLRERNTKDHDVDMPTADDRRVPWGCPHQSQGDDPSR